MTHRNSFKSSMRIDPVGPRHGSACVLHGGSWAYAPDGLRSARRFVYRPGDRINGIGFRLVRTLK